MNFSKWIKKILVWSECNKILCFTVGKEGQRFTEKFSTQSTINLASVKGEGFRIVHVVLSNFGHPSNILIPPMPLLSQE